MVLFVYKHDLEGLVMLKFNSVVDTLTSLNWHSNKQVNKVRAGKSKDQF